MLRSYFKIAVRNLLRDKTYSIINSIGLAVTLAVCIFIFLYVRSEISYDSFFKDSDRIYRVLGMDNQNNLWGTLNLPIDEIKKELPSVQSSTRIWKESGVISFMDKGFEENISMVDPGFFNVFSFPMLYGNRNNSLSDEHSVVLSKEVSLKLFGAQNPIGKKVNIQFSGKTYQFYITAVTDNVPENSSIKYSVLIPYFNIKHTYLGFYTRNNWGISNIAPSVFLKIRYSNDRVKIEGNLGKMLANYASPHSIGKNKYILQPIKSIHLTPGISFSMQPSSNPLYLYLLSGLGILILLIASINFINLSIARSSHRFKEIGIRKVLGASRQKIIYQFLSESMILSIVSLVIAMGLTEIFLPAFNQLTDKNLIFNYYENSGTAVGIILIVIIVGLISGSYPAFYLSRFYPVNILKGEQRLSGRKSGTKTMLVFQLFVSTALLICTMTMSEQFDYLQSKDLGFNKENVVIINNDNEDKRNFYKIFKTEILKYSGIKSISFSNEMPGNTPKYSWSVENKKTNRSVVVSYFMADIGYLKTMGLKLRAGRDFSCKISTDTINSVIVNEAFVDKLGLKHPLGKLLVSHVGMQKNVRIIGVVDNYNYASLAHKIGPVMIAEPNLGYPRYILVRLKPGNLINSLNYLKKRWRSIDESIPFNYTFLDNHLNNLYSSDIKWKKMINYSAVFAVLIVILGLLGLTSYSVEKRFREIGIRKILGASTGSIIRLFYNEYIILIIIANIIAWPVAWFFMNEWLEKFAYKITLNITPFIFSGGLILLSAVVITSAMLIKAASINPVLTLRNE